MQLLVHGIGSNSYFDGSLTKTATCEPSVWNEKKTDFNFRLPNRGKEKIETFVPRTSKLSFYTISSTKHVLSCLLSRYRDEFQLFDCLWEKDLGANLGI